MIQKNCWRKSQWASEENDAYFNKYKSVNFLYPSTSLIIKPAVITTVGLIKFPYAARWEDRHPMLLKGVLSESLGSAIVSL